MMRSGCKSNLTLTRSSMVRTDPTSACRIDLVASTSTITLWSVSIKLASAAKRWPLTRPSPMQRATVVSNKCRKRSLSRKRPCLTRQAMLASLRGPVLGKGRMVRHTISAIKAAEPAISKVEMHLLAKPALGSDAEAIPNQKHADQQLWINRRTASVAVKFCEMWTDTAQIHGNPPRK